MITEPKLIHREEQPFAAIQTTVAMNEISRALPPLIPEVFEWLNKNGIERNGFPFFQYLSIDKEGKLLTAVGVPVKSQVQGNGRITSGSFPRGKYVSVIYNGDYKNIMEAHMALEKWIKESKEAKHENLDNKALGMRAEIYMTDPQKEPDTDKWQTEVIALLV
ncbi:MAG TPA: GyrI-like domain-containing protein [Flavisolibacter sp.]|nr:GyrI-like domain-containing protein [Flavisolibacter sp.]